MDGQRSRRRDPVARARPSSVPSRNYQAGDRDIRPEERRNKEGAMPKFEPTMILDIPTLV